jgi:[1-hydroxy-2-(trimethylamino)ethyl]phosphonate dioxygenase
VRLHVAAKRYLCGVDLAYRAALSPASAQSLQLQGGPMDEAERAGFEASPHFAAAIQLRHYDDLAKTPGAWTPDLEHYRLYLGEALHI